MTRTKVKISRKANNGRHIAYRRFSSADQEPQAQLTNAPVQFDKEYEDIVTGADSKRPQLNIALANLQQDDNLHIQSIDRVARNIDDLQALIDQLINKGIALHFHSEQITFTGTPSVYNSVMIKMLRSIQGFEKAVFHERQREGIAKAKARNAYKGRKKTIDDTKILEELATGLSIRKVAEKLGVNPSTVQRAKRNQTSNTL